MTTDDTQAATKGDLHLLRLDMSAMEERLLKNQQSMMEQFMVLLGDHYDQTAQKIEETKEELTQKITEAKVEAIQHSNVLIEDLKHDFIGFSKDKFKLHDEQIAELQTHAGIR